MKRRSLTAMAILIALALVLTACAGGASPGAGTSGAAATAPAKPAPAPIRWITPGDTAAKPLNMDDRIVQKINEILNIKLTVETVPEGDLTKINVAMASGDLPDIVTGGFNATATVSWIKDGLLVPLNPYLDQNPALKSALTGPLDWSKDDKGNYMGYPFINQYSKSNSCVVYRGDWLKKVGLPTPVTTDDFAKALAAFTKDDPDGNGKADTIGWSATKPVGNFAFIFYAFGRRTGDYELDANNKVIPLHEHESFKPGMQFLAQLWKDGYIDPEFMLNDTKTFEEKLQTGRVGAAQIALFRNLNRHVSAMQKVNPASELLYADAPKGPSGTFGSSSQGKGGMYTSVTNKSKAPAQAAAFINFMLSDEGHDLVRKGIQGIHYTVENGKIVYNEPERQKDSFADNGWAHPLAWGSFYWPLESNYLPETEPNRERAIESVDVATRGMKPNLIAATPAAQVESGSILTDLYNQYFIDMLTGKTDIDKGIAELSQKWRAQGGDKVLAEVETLRK